MNINIHGPVFWFNILIVAPAFWVCLFYVINLVFKIHRICKLLLKNNPIKSWIVLLCAAWSLPKLSKDYCFFEKRDGRYWFSPRLEKFKILPTPKDLGQ